MKMQPLDYPFHIVHTERRKSLLHHQVVRNDMSMDIHLVSPGVIDIRVD